MTLEAELCAGTALLKCKFSEWRGAQMAGDRLRCRLHFVLRHLTFVDPQSGTAFKFVFHFAFLS